MINEKVMEWDTKFGQNLKNMFDEMMGNPIEKIDELIEDTGLEVKEVRRDDLYGDDTQYDEARDNELSSQ